MKRAVDEIRRIAQKRFEESKLHEKSIITTKFEFDLQLIEITTIHLPYEIMLEIFSFLKYNELLETINFTCKGWRLMSSANVLWKQKYLQNFPSEIYFVKKFNLIDISWKHSFLLQLEMQSRWKKNKPRKCYYNIPEDEINKPFLSKSRKQMASIRGVVRYHPANDPNKLTKKKKSPILHLNFNSEYLISLNQMHEIEVLNLKALSKIKTLKVKGTNFVIFTNLLIISDQPSSFCVFDLKSSKIIQKFVGSSSSRLKSLKTFTHFLLCTYERDVLLFNLKTYQKVNQLTNIPFIYATDFTSTQLCLIEFSSATNKYYVTCYLTNIPNLVLQIQKIEIKPDKVNRCVPSSVKLNNTKIYLILTGIKYSNIIVYSIKEGEIMTQYSFGQITKQLKMGSMGRIVKFSKDKTKFGVINGQTIQIYHLKTGKLISSITHNSCGGMIMNYAFDNTWLCIGTQFGGIISRFFGSSELYWSGMKGGHVLE